MSNRDSSGPNRFMQVLYLLDEAAYRGVQWARGGLAESRKRPKLGAILVALLIAVALWVFRPWAGGAEATTRSRLTSNGSGAAVSAAALSPDGETLAYADADGLHLLNVETLRARPVDLPDEMPVERLVWAPDGERIYLAARRTAGFAGSLWVLQPSATQPRQLLDGVEAPTLSPDGSRFAFVREQAPGKSIWTAGLDGQDASVLLDSERYDYVHPAWAPDGKRLAFVRVRTDLSDATIVTARIGGGKSVPAVVNFDRRTAPCWTPEGRLIFGRTEREGSSLWSVTIDLDTGEPEAEPAKIADEVGVAYFAHLSVDREGKRLGFVPIRTQVDAYLADLDPQDRLAPPSRIQSRTGDHWPVAWADDGASLLVHFERDGHSSVLLQSVDRGDSRSVTTGRLLARAPDGSILFQSEDGSGLMSTSSTGGEVRPIGHSPPDSEVHRPNLRCSRRTGGRCVMGIRDGDVLRFHAFDPGKPAGEGPHLGRVSLANRDYGWNLSPDGGRVAVVNGGRTVKLVNLHNASVRELKIESSVYAQTVAWSADAGALYVTGMILHGAGGYVLYRVDLAGRAAVLWQTADRWFAEPVPSPDGRRLALAARTVEGDAWLLEHF